MTATQSSPNASDGEAEIIRRAMLGEAADFARLVTAHYDRVYRLAYRLVGRKEDAEDVAQEVCIKLANNLASYRFEAPFSAWLNRLVLNSARDYLRVRVRRQNRELPMFEDADWVAGYDNPEQTAAAREQLARVDQLPEALKETVILVFGAGLSHAEAAQTLGCAESTVSWRIHEARKALQAAETAAKPGAKAPEGAAE